MNTVNEHCTFWTLLNKYCIIIPKLQRNYVQGSCLPMKSDDAEPRLKGSRLIDSVIKSLAACQSENESPNMPPLYLDFVYGSVSHTLSSEGKLSTIYPIDGQQRLTLLWLIHWYIGMHKEGGLSNEEKKIMENFSYDTRTSSRLFIFNLIHRFTPNLRTSLSIRKQIEECYWFYSKWLFDPTIDSMINVLEYKLEKYLKNCNLSHLWEKLTSSECPILFAWEDIGKYHQTDDLYIKMNGRGKLLESLDNFRADVVDYFKDNDGGAKCEWISNLMAEFQGPWTELFWNKLSNSHKELLYKCSATENDHPISIEVFLYELMSRFFFCRCVRDNGNASKLIYDFGNQQLHLQYNNLAVFSQDETHLKTNLESILREFEALMTKICLIENQRESNSFYINDLSKPYWPGAKICEILPIPDINNANKVRSITQPDMVVFYAVTQYILKMERLPQYDDGNELWNSWMRLIWNIVDNSDINNEDTMISHIRLVGELSDNLLNPSCDFYTALAQMKLTSGSAKDQILEEKEKAPFRDSDLKNEIEYLENEFHGQIYMFYKDDRSAKSLSKETFIQRHDKWKEFTKISNSRDQAECLLSCHDTPCDLAKFYSKEAFTFPQKADEKLYTGMYLKSHVKLPTLLKLLCGQYNDKERPIFREFHDCEKQIFRIIENQGRNVSYSSGNRPHLKLGGQGGGRIPLDNDSLKIGKLLIEVLKDYEERYGEHHHNDWLPDNNRGYVWYHLRDGWHTPFIHGRVDFEREHCLFYPSNTDPSALSNNAIWYSDQNISILSEHIKQIVDKGNIVIKLVFTSSSHSS